MKAGAVTVIGTVTALVVLAGCSGEPMSAEATGDPGALGLTGPWAQEFADAIARSQSSSEKAILSDGTVTPAELEAAHDGVRRCLNDSGLNINYYDRGGFELPALDGTPPKMPFEKSDAILRSCEKRNDEWVTFLYQQIRRNPENLDEATIEIACFKRHDVVPKSYTRSDYDSDSDGGSGPFAAMTGAARDCQDDPLGLWLDK